MDQLPAEAVLASALLQAHQTRRKPAQYLRTGSASVDAAIDPGLPYGAGSVNCISNTPGAAGKELLFSFLISHLLASPSNTASIIDSVEQDLITLLDVTKSRLAQKTYINPNLPPRDLDQEAGGVLDRLNLMRIFSHEELADALSEYRDTLDHQASPQQAISPAANRINTIPDSQSTQADTDLLALLDSAPDQVIEPSAPRQAGSPAEQTPTSLLIIDDIPTIFSPLLRSSYTHASSLLSSLLRSLYHLTSQHPLCVLLVNGTTTPSRSPDRRYLAQGAEEEEGRMAKRVEQRGPSIFAGCEARPMFHHLVMGVQGVNMLVHRVPRTEGDARAVYAERTGRDQGERIRGGAGTMRWVDCVEVIGDREGGRYQKFGFLGGTTRT
ncbi:hypothetical protein CAC42_128 [Sphaceloma murrayae]|uniref:Uncharacterized protein n=1 Tax=Sphaceloma murrayae TaxID=2082308 RepID=A0A2K1QMM9_9PEZI|nr:hypothetical protein CAC42_128 [Sphaceloma murrayae]